MSGAARCALRKLPDVAWALSDQHAGVLNCIALPPPLLLPCCRCRSLLAAAAAHCHCHPTGYRTERTLIGWNTTDGMRECVAQLAEQRT
jgi:hypothetical protein